MAFLRKVGGILQQTASKQIGTADLSACNPSVFRALRWMSSSKLFVGGLSYGTDEMSLKDAFEQYGQVVEARVITDRESGRSRGFGFVTYTASEEAASAIQALDGKELHGRVVRVNYATDRARGPVFGGGDGYNSGWGNYNSGGGGGNYGPGGGNYGPGGGNYGPGGGNYGPGGGGNYGPSSGGNNYGPGGGGNNYGPGGGSYNAEPSGGYGGGAGSYGDGGNAGGVSHGGGSFGSLGGGGNVGAESNFTSSGNFGVTPGGMGNGNNSFAGGSDFKFSDLGQGDLTSKNGGDIADDGEFGFGDKDDAEFEKDFGDKDEHDNYAKRA